jgi:uncharacterized Zn finger protein (UPF0148 family)
MYCDTECLFPIYCRVCRALEEVNLLTPRVTCPTCGREDVVAYDNPEVIGKKGRREVFSWHMEEELGRILRLTDGRYLCPACQRTELRFESMGRFD